MKLCPFRFTNKFYRKLTTLFFVQNFSRQMDLLKRQFISGQAKHLGGDKFLVMVKDFEAEVVVKDGTFVTINLGG